MLNKKNDFCLYGLNVIEKEAQAVSDLCQRIDEKFARACELLFQCKGRIVVIGVGKSGHIARKIAATFAATGTPAFFVHAAEAGHGDMGMITDQDIVIAISNSGNTDEILVLIPFLKRQSIPLIALTGTPDSIIAKAATVHLDVSVIEEACPLGLTPTTSTIAALAMGDALAIALLQKRGSTAVDFARSHPGGRLGKRLLLKIDDLMVNGASLPKVHYQTVLIEALVEITEKKRGMTTVVDDNNKLLGIFTDGDLRRTLSKGFNVHETTIHQVMTKNCKTISLGLLATEALALMEKHRISVLVVTNENNQPIGLIHMYDLLDAGII